MQEQMLSGGYFGEATPPVAPPSALDLVVHGGYFGGTPEGPNPSSPPGLEGDFDFVLVDNLLEYGTPCEVQPREAGPYRLPHGAIFRASHQAVDITTGAAITSDQPHANVRALELHERWTDRDLAICRDRKGRDRLFRVRDVQPDGEVGQRLMLHEVKA